MQKTEKILKLYNWLQNATAWTKMKSLIKIRPVVPEKNTKMWRKFWKFTIGCRMPQREQKSKFHQDKTRSYWENQSLIKMKAVVPEKNAKNWENFETLQLAAECQSMNKNQCLMKTSSSSEKCKKVMKFWNFTIGCRVTQHKQKSKLDQGQTSSSLEKCKILRNFWNLQLAAEWDSINKSQSLIKITPIVPEKYAKKWRKFQNFTIGCRVLWHKQKSKFDQDQTSSSWEKCQKVKKIWKLYSWLQSGTA